MQIEEFVARLAGVKQTGDAYTAKCPGHDDRQNSLSVKRGNDDRILAHCHAGCAVGDILSPIGLSVRDLFPPKTNGRANSNGRTKKNGRGKQVAAYAYTDESGQLLYEKIRYDPKSFLQRRPDGKGGYLWKLGDVERVLYNLPNVITQVGIGKAVFVCEGEKDADRLNSLGLVATTNQNGAGEKWRPEFSAVLGDTPVVILPDNDLSGIRHAWAISTQINNAFVLELPGLQKKGDVSEWLDAGHSKDELLDLAREVSVNPPEMPAELVEPETPDAPVTPEQAAAILLTELANSRRLADTRGDDLLHSSAYGWLCWDGKRWARSEKAARRLAHDTGAIIRKEAADSIADYQTAMKFWKFASRMETSAGITSTLKECAVLEGIDADDVEFDAHPWRLNCPNGTVDLRTGEMRPHARADRITKLCPTPYQPGATCERFLEFLDQIFDGDDAIVNYLQWYAGYSLSGDTSHDCFAILYGEGGNGKSTLITVLKEVIGADFAQELNPEELLAHRGDRHSTELAQLRGARFVSAIETNEGKRLNESLIKGLTGGDKVRARFMRRDSFEFQPELKLWLATNHKPEICDTSDGMWRRVRLIPFLRKFEGGDRVSKLNYHLVETEAEGILAWAVEGAKQAAVAEPEIPEKVRAAVEEYRADEDLVSQFLELCCNEHPDIRVGKSDLHKAFSEWNSGGVTPPLKAFNSRIRARGVGEGRMGKGRSAWLGIGLAPSEGEADVNH